MERGERVPVPIALFIAAEICKGLSYAHGLKDEKGKHLGIVHRDVSPSNVLFSMSGEVKITDFGLARAVTHVELTDPGVIKGKFSYLCPEALLENPEIDHRADLFSVGIILWEMLAGRRLFVGDTDAAILEMIEHSNVPSLRKLNPDVPFEVEEIIGRALAKSPSGRYSNANAMGEAILDVLFKKSLKVGAYDMAEYVKRLKTAPIEGEAPESPFIRIQSLIKEEILNLSMVGSGESGVTGNVPALAGSNPLSDGSLSLERMKGASQFKDIWDVSQMDKVQRDDLFAEKAVSSVTNTDDSNRAALFWLGGLTAVFVLLLVVYFLTN
jgi:eukaryotic-like serine/threonine-protein kinase